MATYPAQLSMYQVQGGAVVMPVQQVMMAVPAQYPDTLSCLAAVPGEQLF